MTTVLSLSTPNMADVVALTRPTHEAIAGRHGYTHLHIVHPGDSERPPVWAKIDAIYEQLEAGNNVWWFDADAATNPEKNPYTGRDVTASCDINGLNAGVFHVSSNPETLRLFYACKTHGYTLFGDRVTGEQMALQHFTSHEPYCGMITYLPQRSLNSYWPGAYEYPGCENDHWRTGDFVLHLPGLTNERRVEILKEALGYG